MSTRTRQWLIGFGVWTLLALLSASQSAVRHQLEGRPIDWGRLVTGALVGWYSCAIFTPSFFQAARRFPIDAKHWTRHLPIHAAICAGASVLKYVIEWTVMSPLLGYYTVSLTRVLGAGFISENIAFWCMAAAIHAIEFQRRARDRELVTSRLQARLSAAKLNALAARLQPHFLFNTLQSISTLVHRDPTAADRMIGHLSNLLRAALHDQHRHEVTLGEEMANLEEYLALMQVRFGNRITIERAIDPETLAGWLPSFALQPLLENAFQHGVARRAGPGWVRIAARRVQDRLVLTVADDGAGLPSEPIAERVGLGSIRARLTELHGENGSLQVNPRPGGGTVATLTLPWLRQPQSAALEVSA